ncbi:PadR family transcriptional regulator [Micromonospora deserti]|uniref:PadR family transcriptional regulator n=1 Tax=Micromonospora deserti TaxID=2070366 RepID=A0A2W2DV96_9ACTN|nr:PadR family transcriptional regulator [Micromonospora deserti]PZF96753.1 PadR family transcriptional regulator [Micromonospora deserti]
MARPRMSSAMLDVLGLLLEAWDQQTEVHGWQIMRSVRRSGPAVYAVLDQLEDAGWITGSWQHPPAGAEGRPRRRYYRLTPSGAEAARRQAVARPRVPSPRPRPAPGFGLHRRARPAS